jgi:hypothetical protein
MQRMRLVILSILSLFLTTAQLNAQIGFSSLPGPNGGVVNDLEINSTGTIFASVASPSGGAPSTGTLYRSTNNGTAWTKMTDIPELDAIDIFINDNDDVYVLGKNGIYKSTDNGNTWTSTAPVGFPGGEFLIKTDDGDLFMGEYFDGVFRSTDEGVTWVNVNNTLPVNSVSAMGLEAIIGVANDVYVSISNFGTYRSLNPNTNSPAWAAVNSGLSTPDQAASFALKGTTLYQTNRNGAYSFNGTTWTMIASQSGTGNFLLNENFNNSDHIVINGSGTRLYIVFKTSGRVYASANATTGPWTSIAALQISDRFTDMAVNGDNLFVGTERNSILRSLNNGTSFSPADGGIFLSPASGFLLVNSEGLIITTDGSPKVSVTTNETTFNKYQVDNVCLGCGVYSLFELANGDVLTIGNETYRSTDAQDGTTWTDIGGPPAYLPRVVTGNNTIFFGHNYNSPIPAFYKSTKAAVSFTAFSITGTLFPTDFEVRNLVADASSNLYLFLYNRTANQPELWKVNAGGTTAVKITNTTFTNGIDNLRIVGNTLFVMGRPASGNRKIAKSINGGTSWTFVDLGNLDAFDFFAYTTDVFVAMGSNSSGRHFEFTNDAGVTWQSAFDESSNTQVNGGEIDDNGYLYVSISNGPIYKSSGPVLRPATPTNLAAAATGENLVELSWDHDKAFTSSFIIQRRLQSGGPFVSVDTISQDLYFTDYNLTKLTGYVYRVIALGAAGSNTSAEFSVVTKDDCPSVSIPDNKSWTGVVAGGFTNTAIGIKKVSPDIYQITDVTAGSLVGVARVGGGSPYSNTTVSTFLYENCSEPFITSSSDVHANGIGTWNSTTKTLVLNFQIDKGNYVATEKTITLTVNTDDPIPGPPLSVAAYVYDNTSIKIEWAADFFQNKYIVHRSTSPGFTPGPTTEIEEVPYPTISYIDQGPLAFGTTYYYKVIALNSDASPQSSTPSPEVSVLFSKPQFVPSNTTVWNTNAAAATSAWVDFNNDGFEDLIMPILDATGTTSTEPLLYQNTGSDFTLLTGKFSTGQAYVNPSIGDYDNDGLIDVYMSAISFDEDDTPQKYVLFKNNGSFNFTEQVLPVISEPGVGGSFSSSWTDYNSDGALDLFVANQEYSKPLLYQGNGLGAFTKIATGALATDQFNNGFATWSDYDNSGTPDVLIVAAEDYDPDDGGPAPSVSNAFRLFKNTAGTFSKIEGTVLDTDDAVRVFSYSWGDYDNDLDFDLFAVNQGSGSNLLYKNLGDGTFQKIAVAAGTPTETQPGSVRSFGSTWGDIDNDGDLDLLVTKGFETGSAIYRNDGAGSFTKISGEVLTNAPGFHLSASLGDYNRDGFLDVAVGQITFVENGPPLAQPNIQLLKNNNTTGNWVQIKLEGNRSNKSAIGAKIIVRTTGKNQIREITSHTGFGSQNSLIAHFGLGSATTINQIEIKWPSGVTNIYSNKGINQYYTFVEDGDAPVVTVRVPGISATGVAVNTPVSITLNESTTPVANKKLKVYASLDLATPVHQLNVTAGVHTGNTYTFSLPANLTAGTEYRIEIEAGAFLDDFSNAFVGLVSSGWIFTTDSAPVVSSRLPEHNTAAIAINTSIKITFNKNVTAGVGKKLKVKDGSTAIVDIDVSTSGTVTDNVYTFTPSTPLPNAKLLTVEVDAGAFVATGTSAPFAGIGADVWSFTTVTAADIVAPVITFIPPATAAKGFGTQNPEITVIDDRGTVSAVVITIKKISGTAASAVTVPATQGIGTNANKWVFSISESNHFDAIGTEYFIEAKDPANNVARNPAAGTHKLFLTYTASESKIPSDKLGFGGAISNWKVFSIPFELGSNNSFTTIFNELDGKANKVDFRFLTIQPTSNKDWTEYPSFTTITRGQGYFSNIKTPVDILLGPQQAPENSRTNLFTLNLKAGWNMVGNPYLTQISWADVKTMNSLTGQMAELHKFNGSTYPIGVQTLDAFEGGFVFAQADQTLTVPFLGQTTSGGRAGYHSLGDDINNSEWLLQLNVHQNGTVNDLGSIGMASDAKLSLDDYDGVTPPRFIEFLETNFAHPEHFAKRFTRDIVPTQNEYTWNFSVDTNLDGEAEIFWDNSAFANGTKEIFLFDQNRQRLIDMKTVSRYSFNPKESVNFKVYFGENLKIVPESVLLGKAFPNPTSGTTNIAFSLPDSGGQNQFVTLDILDATGRTMGVIAQGRFQPGFYETGFSAKDFNNGFYTYRLTVQNSRGTNTLVNKLIIK